MIIRQVPGPYESCRVCSGTVDLPHKTEAECRAAISKEVEVLLTRARKLSKTAWELAVKHDAALARRATDRLGRQSKQKRR